MNAPSGWPALPLQASRALQKLKRIEKGGVYVRLTLSTLISEQVQHFALPTTGFVPQICCGSAQSLAAPAEILSA
jgi:hypothetical protein